MATKKQPSEDVSPEKARQILKDGTVHGKPLTEAQRGMFGAAAGKGKALSNGMNSLYWYHESATHKPVERIHDSELESWAQREGFTSSFVTKIRNLEVGERFNLPDGWYIERHKSLPGTPESEPEHKMHRKKIGEASGFLKQLANERAFGDAHREKAYSWHKELDGIANGGKEPEAEMPVPEPGEMGEKNLHQIYLDQQQALASLGKKLEKLNGTLVKA